MSTRDENILRAMKKHAVDHYDVKFFFKDESPLMKFIYVVSFMWIWNREFMTRYTTTVGNRIYWGTDKRKGEQQAYRMYKTLAHELRHIVRKNRDGHVSYTYDYMAPQIFGIVGAVVVLLALMVLGVNTWLIDVPFYSPWWFMSGMLLPFLGPWPSAGRTHIEVEAYTMSHAVDVWRGVQVRQPADYIVKALTTMQYFKPCWDKPQLISDLQEGIDLAKSGEYEKQSALALQIKLIITSGGECMGH